MDIIKINSTKEIENLGPETKRGGPTGGVNELQNSFTIVSEATEPVKHLTKLETELAASDLEEDFHDLAEIAFEGLEETLLPIKNELIKHGFLEEKEMSIKDNTLDIRNGFFNFILYCNKELRKNVVSEIKLLAKQRDLVNESFEESISYATTNLTNDTLFAINLKNEEVSELSIIVEGKRKFCFTGFVFDEIIHSYFEKEEFTTIEKIIEIEGKLKSLFVRNSSLEDIQSNELIISDLPNNKILYFDGNNNQLKTKDKGSVGNTSDIQLEYRGDEFFKLLIKAKSRWLSILSKLIDTFERILILLDRINTSILESIDFINKASISSELDEIKKLVDLLKTFVIGYIKGAITISNEAMFFSSYVLSILGDITRVKKS